MIETKSFASELAGGVATLTLDRPLMVRRAPNGFLFVNGCTSILFVVLLIQRVGEILAYQSYNTKSPLNGRAAQWVDEHRDQLPIDREEFFIDLHGAPEAVADAAVVCANCGAAANGDGSATCPAAHALCGDCAMVCKTCGTVLCLVCNTYPCVPCARAAAEAQASAT